LRSPSDLPTVRSASKQLQEIKEATIYIQLPEINKLHFEDLPNLRSFSSGDIVEWPSLEHVTMNHCPNLKKFGLGTIKSSQLKSIILENHAYVDIDAKIVHLFELLDELSMITEYNVEDSQELSNTMDNLRPLHFINLLLFSAKSCDERINKFLSILIKRSNELQYIKIEQCKTLKHLFDLNELIHDKDGHGMYFRQIKGLILIELHQLTCIWNKDPTGIFGLGNMQIMKIKSCSSLKNLFTSSAAEKLHQLNELKLEACEMLEKVVDNDMSKEVVNNGIIKTIKFPNLSKVEFKSLSRLIWFYLYPLEFPNLKTLIIEKCPHLKEFIIGFVTANASHITDEKSLFELNKLKLDSCNKLICVVSSKTLQELRKLKKLIVSHCKALEMVFNIHGEKPYSIELLQQLDELILIDLPKLTHIINKEVFKFCQNMQILQVRQCKSLNWLPGSLMLTNIEISDCDALEKIMIIDKEGMKGKSTFSNLKHVFLENLKNLSIIFPFTSEFPSLETLKITNCPALMTFVEESNKLKDLPESVASNYFFSNSVFNFEDDNLDQKIQEMLPQLMTLALSNLSSLTSVWNKEPQVPIFPNLVSLYIIQCGTLKTLFSLSSTKNLGKLKVLKLCNCEKLEEVISSEKNENVSIIFPKMECLVLKDLPKLVSFCGHNGTFNWPNLQIVRVSNIPSMKTFSRGNLNTPLLRSVHIIFARKLWLGHLNKTISYMYNNS
ncbi:Disease resistance protein RPS2, partial [Mucuna pruriens]